MEQFDGSLKLKMMKIWWFGVTNFWVDDDGDDEEYYLTNKVFN